jgi:hypothetical protein
MRKEETMGNTQAGRVNQTIIFLMTPMMERRSKRERLRETWLEKHTS